MLLTKFDHDFGMLVRAHLVGLGLETVANSSQSFNYTHTERKAVIEKSLKQIYDIIGVTDTPDIKTLANSIYSNYQGLSYRYFPELRKPYDLKGSINSVGESCISIAEIIDERDWTKRRTIYARPLKFKSFGRSVSSDNLSALLQFFTLRPVFDLNILKRQLEETLKLLYTNENRFEIELHVFYGD
jgi:hypothetical protein